MTPEALPLKDIHVPELIGWWPLAIGWWLLLILIPTLVLLCIWLYKRVTRNTALKSAANYFNKLKQNEELDDFDKVCELSILIRRISMSQSGRQNTAHLTGKQWLQYLDNSMVGEPFSKGVGKILIEAPYRADKQVNIDMNKLVDVCGQWLKAQKKQKR